MKTQDPTNSLTPVLGVHQGLLKNLIQLLLYTQYLALMRFKQKAAIITVQWRHHPLVEIILKCVHLFLVAFILSKSNIKLGLSMCFFSEVSVPLSILQYYIYFMSNLSLHELT